jgi:hypothetical protein
MDAKMTRSRRPGPDDRTLDRILSGTASPQDLPPDWGAVAQLLRAVASPSDGAPPPVGSSSEGGAPQDSPLDRQTLAAMASILTESARRTGTRAEARSWGRSTRVRSPLVRLSRVAAMAALALFLMVGMAFAGVLPGPLQDVAHSALSKVGISVPRDGVGDDQQGGSQAPSPDDQTGDTGNQHTVVGGRGPDAAGPAKQGLCNAYLHGKGGASGGKDESTAFRKLAEAAAAAGQTVEEYCGVPSSGSSGHSKGAGGSKGQAGAEGQGGSGGSNGHGNSSHGHSSSEEDHGNGGKDSHARDDSNGRGKNDD